MKTSILALLVACGLCAAALAGDHPIETDALRKPALSTGGSCVIRNVTIHSAVAPATQRPSLVGETSSTSRRRLRRFGRPR